MLGCYFFQKEIMKNHTRNINFGIKDFNDVFSILCSFPDQNPIKSAAAGDELVMNYEIFLMAFQIHSKKRPHL